MKPVQTITAFKAVTWPLPTFPTLFPPSLALPPAKLIHYSPYIPHSVPCQCIKFSRIFSHLSLWTVPTSSSITLPSVHMQVLPRTQRPAENASSFKKPLLTTSQGNHASSEPQGHCVPQPRPRALFLFYVFLV